MFRPIGIGIPFLKPGSNLSGEFRIQNINIPRMSVYDPQQTEHARSDSNTLKGYIPLRQKIIKGRYDHFRIHGISITDTMNVVNINNKLVP